MPANVLYQPKKVFVASPIDVMEERRAFSEMLGFVNEIKAHPLGIHLEPSGWERTLPGIGRPQGLIDEDVRECDVFVMLLWKRWGAPTGEWTSGTQEEFELARKLYLDRKKPERILLYFREIPQDMLEDPGEQLQQVLDFREQIRSDKTESGCLYSEYRDITEWRFLLTKHLCRWLDSCAQSLPEQV